MSFPLAMINRPDNSVYFTNGRFSVKSIFHTVISRSLSDQNTEKHRRPSERFTPKVDICSTYVVITLFLQRECTRHVPYPGGF